MNVAIDPGVVTLIQSTFLEHINVAFSTATRYAFNLLYLFAALELTVLGLAWALQRDTGWSKIFFKIIKIGLIFFIIQNYSWLLNTIVSSFAKLAGIVINNDNVAQYVFNPAKIWKYGYDIGIYFLQLAFNNTILGPTMIQICLGMGILLVFGLLGIQMIVQMVSFYLVSFGALIFLPFGALSASSNMLDKAVQSVLQAGARLMTLIIIIGIAVTTWDGFQLADLTTATDFNINQALGLFFTALLFLCLAFYLPKIVGQVVGGLSSSILESNAQAVTIVREPATPTMVTTGGGMANIQAASTIAPGSNPAYEGISSTASAATIPATTAGITTSGIDSQTTKDALSQASRISKSISEGTVKKIKEAVVQAMKEKTT